MNVKKGQLKTSEIKVDFKFTHPTLGNVIVITVHPLGTLDVRNIWTDRCYRITGLPMN